MDVMRSPRHDLTHAHTSNPSTIQFGVLSLVPEFGASAGGGVTQSSGFHR